MDDTALVGMFLDRYNRKEKIKRLQIALREQENGLSQCSQKMEDGEPSISIMTNITLIIYLCRPWCTLRPTNSRCFGQMFKFFNSAK